MPFARPTLEDLLARIRSDLETRLPGADAHLRRSLVGALASMHAGAMHGLYGHLEWLGRQLFPDTADGAELERWAGIWGLTRKAAVKSAGSVDFTGTDGTDIPAGTVLQRSDGVEFITDALVTVAAGVATAAVTAGEGGADGDTAAGAALTLVAPIAGVDGEATVGAAGLTGGLDEESDADLLSRLLLRIAVGPPSGKGGDYAQWALENSAVTRAWDYAEYLGLGTVGVTFTLDNAAMDATIIPDAAKVQAVQDYVDARRPRPSAVTVFAPTPIVLNLTIQLTPNTAVVQAAVNEELKDLLRRDGEPGGTLLLSRINEAISLADGETDHVLVSPAANVAHNPGEIPVMGAITWQ